MEGTHQVPSAHRREATQAAHPHTRIPGYQRGARGLRVVLAPRNGEVFVDIRIWREAEDGSWIPTSDGVRFNAALAPAVADELMRVANEADKLPGAGAPGS